MIYAQISDGSQTAYVSLGGMQKLGRFYDAGIMACSALEYKKKNAQTKLDNTRLEVQTATLKALDLKKPFFEVRIYADATAFKALKEDALLVVAHAYIMRTTTLSVHFWLKEKEFTQNFLQEHEGKALPAVFGEGICVPLVAKSVLEREYFVEEGTIEAVFDDGKAVEYTQAKKGIIKLKNKVFGRVYAHIKKDSSLFLALQKIATKLSLKLDTSQANSAVINHVITEQLSCMQLLSQLCNYSNNFFCVKGEVLHVYALKYKEENTVNKTAFDVLKNGVCIQENPLVSTLQARWSSLAVLNEVLEEQIGVEKISVYPQGKVKHIEVFDTDKTRIKNVLELKKEQALLQNVRLELCDIQAVVLAQSIAFKTEELEGVLCVHGFTYDLDRAVTIIEGEGVIKEWKDVYSKTE